MSPKIIKKEKLRIAGVAGDGFKTAEIWQAYEALEGQISPEERKDTFGYEVRVANADNLCHVGCAVKRGAHLPQGISILEIPESLYAVFEVFVARGYMSENDAMGEWLEENADSYSHRMLEGSPYVVEFYDERFQGDDKGSIVEIWLPLEKK